MRHDGRYAGGSGGKDGGIGVTDEPLNLDLDYGPKLGAKTDYKIGVIGAGFIMRDVHLAAYEEAGFDVVAIASRTPQNARAAAELRGIERVHDEWHDLLADPEVEIVDIAYPPDQQLGIIREAVKHAGHLKGILAQKPLATNLADATEIVRLCDEAGIPLAVNQNMRYDQSMRALKTLLDRGYLGDPVVAQITMHARPHWQSFIREYDRVAILNMSIHHIDIYRFLFGDPERILVSVRTDPRTDFLTKRRPDYWFQPRWQEQWFPQAFIGTMAQLMSAVETGTEPEISGHDNLKTMALLEAAYRSASEGRAVDPRQEMAEAPA